MNEAQVPKGPIPGANYTSDTRNWPWHRPPDITDLDEAIEYVSLDLNESEDGLRYVAMMESGIPINAIADIIVTKGIGRGKWSPDFAILVAGPVARLLEITAKVYDVDYDLGIDEEIRITSPEVVRELGGDPAFQKKPEKKKEKEPEEEQGFMSAVPQEEQEAMLGYGPEDEEVENV